MYLGEPRNVLGFAQNLLTAPLLVGRSPQMSLDVGAFRHARAERYTYCASSRILDLQMSIGLIYFMYFKVATTVFLVYEYCECFALL